MTQAQWDKGRLRLSKLGGMISALELVLPDGRRIDPLHKAPWLGEELPGDLPPLLAGLQGEWPCVPFGSAPNGALGGDWAGFPHAPDPWPHGYSSNHDWHIEPVGADGLRAQIMYPSDDPVHHLTRNLRGVDGKAAVEIDLSIHMRRAARLPIGIHPVFRLPTTIGNARLSLGSYENVHCYPADTGGRPVLSNPDPFWFDDLNELGFDPLRLPYHDRSETLLLVSGSDGNCTLENHEENYRVTLTWEPTAFPSLMLWISNGGRTSTPWNGRHWAVGIEPVCSAFDLGSTISAADNPLSRLGVKTAHMLTPEEPFTTRYQIEIAPL